MISTIQGFNFEGWTFKLNLKGNFYCVPSFKNYKNFRHNVKKVIDNSNYSSKTKAIKLFPLVYDWRYYHRFCTFNVSKNILFSLQKKAFKVFNKEVKQNRFSTKRLLTKAFPRVYFYNILPNTHNFFHDPRACKHIIYYDNTFFCLHCGRLTF